MINIPNSGVSSARNRGIQLAKSKNIMFLDGDDILKKESLDNILKKLKSNNSDMYYFEFEDWFENGKIISYKNLGFNSKNYTNSIEMLKDKISCKIWLCIGNVVYNKEFLQSNNLQFDSSTDYGEDMEFINKSLHICNKLLFIENSKLLIRNREGSATRSNFTEKSLDVLVANRRFYEYIENSDINNKEKNLLLNLINEEWNLSKRYICNSIIDTYKDCSIRDIKRKLKKYKLLELKKVEKRSIRKHNRKLFLKDSIYAISPIIYVYLYKFTKVI